MATNGTATNGAAKTAAIPLIDLSSPTAPAELLQAASTYGFASIVHENLNVTQKHVHDMFELARRLFELPTEEKAEYKVDFQRNGHFWGWVGMNAETLDPKKQKRGDFKEAFSIVGFKDGQPGQRFPEPLKEQQEMLITFYNECLDLLNRILTLFAIALEIPESEGGESWFAQRHDKARGHSASVLRFNRYPRSLNLQSREKEDLGCGAHSDYGSVTLLFRLPSQPGLEILTPEGEWAAVPIETEAESSSKNMPILINFGDLLDVWSNGLLKSTMHRVVLPPEGKDQTGVEDRYSVVFFGQPDDDAKLVPMPSKIVQERASKTDELTKEDNKPLTAIEWLLRRLAATF